MIYQGEAMRIVLGILPNVHVALALTEALIAGGCAANSIFLLMARENLAFSTFENEALLVSIGEHLGTSVYCVGDPTCYTELVFDRAVQHQRYVQLIDCFATRYPTDWQFHQKLITGGSPVSVVHLEELHQDEPTIARMVLAHSVTRLQISDLPNGPRAD